ncbi:hypothetical protein [Hymenobacter glacieicola]|uniref:Uncharacterized protein n=1 Tax=Hymenobacter glacieicola TaxID=1562124 RepID=A0ABQ1WVD0_9BACT|nr:hypothetical protein [Hymenobacter glacieicola]GGG47047.1 hypothetical protein GCM10011378_24080 [Hymenobacter glacieicola]
MNDVVLRAKHWQVFMFLLVPHFLSWYTEDGFLSGILGFLCAFCLITWLILQSNELMRLRPEQDGYNMNWFLVDAFLMLSAYGYSTATEDPHFHISGTNWHADGVGGFVFLYVVFAYLHIHWFPGSLLYASQTGRRPDAAQAVKGFLLCFFWPIGVWFIQPRLNKLWEEKQWEERAVRQIGTDEKVL